MPPALQNPFVLWLVLSGALAAAAWYGIRKELRWRAILYGSFLIACAVAIWPPYDREGQPGKIRLGLDLKGGIHLVLQVMTDDALNVVVDDAVATVREQAAAKGITIGGAQRTSTTALEVVGVEPARVKDMRLLLSDFFREWEIREPAEGRFAVGMTENMVKDLRNRTVDEAIPPISVKARAFQRLSSEPLKRTSGSIPRTVVALVIRMGWTRSSVPCSKAASSRTPGRPRSRFTWSTSRIAWLTTMPPAMITPT